MIKYLRRAKLLYNVAIGKEIFICVDCIHKDANRFGSSYGGWDVVTNNLNCDSVVYSFGVGEDASFEVDLIKKFGMEIHAFDPTPRSIAWVKGQRLSPRFIMHEYGIAAFDGRVTFFPPENPQHISHTMVERPATKNKAIEVGVKRVSTIMNELNHNNVDILKMDVEGAEYDVIDDIISSGIRPSQILVEFHHRFPGIGIEKTKNAIFSIRNAGYRLFSVSSTNQECSFVKLDE